MMEVNEVLKDILTKINFLERFRKLYYLHSNVDSMDSPDIGLVCEKIQARGYDCKYFKKNKFFKVTNKEKKYTSLHFAVEYGIAEFILNASIKGDECGKTFSMLTVAAGSDERVKNPYFKDYEELDEILDVGFSIYEDISSEIDKANL